MKRIFREYRVEFLALLIALLGIFLLTEQFELRKMVFGFLQNVFASLKGLGGSVLRGIGDYLANFTLSDLLGWILILLTIAFIAWRIRYRFIHSEYWQATLCPKCGSELHRIHRTSLDTLISNTLLPGARRYECANPDCDWSGLRQHRHSERVRRQRRKTSASNSD